MTEKKDFLGGNVAPESETQIIPDNKKEDQKKGEYIEKYLTEAGYNIIGKDRDCELWEKGNQRYLVEVMSRKLVKYFVVKEKE